MGSLSGRTVLIVEDEPLIALDLGQTFEDAGASVNYAFTLREALSALSLGSVSAAVVDRNLPDGDGSSLNSLLTARGIPYVIVTGQHAGHYDTAGAFISFAKPADPVKVLRALENMFEVDGQRYLISDKV